MALVRSGAGVQRTGGGNSADTGSRSSSRSRAATSTAAGPRAGGARPTSNRDAAIRRLATQGATPGERAAAAAAARRLGL